MKLQCPPWVCPVVLGLLVLTTGFAAGLLAVRYTALRDIIVIDTVPPGPKPTAIRTRGIVIVVEVEVRAESDKRFAADPTNRIYLSSPTGMEPDEVLLLTEKHLVQLNEALAAGHEDPVPLRFELKSSTAYVPTKDVNVVTLVSYGGKLIVEGKVLRATELVE